MHTKDAPLLSRSTNTHHDSFSIARHAHHFVQTRGNSLSHHCNTHEHDLPLSYIHSNGLLSQPSGTSPSLHHAHKRLRPVRVYQEDIRSYFVTSDASLTNAKIHTATLRWPTQKSTLRRFVDQRKNPHCDASLTNAKIHTAPTCCRHEHIALSSTNTPPRRTSTSSSSSTRTHSSPWSRTTHGPRRNPSLVSDAMATNGWINRPRPSGCFSDVDGDTTRSKHTHTQSDTHQTTRRQSD